LGPAKQDFSKPDNVDCRRSRLQIDYRSIGLENSQSHIKLLHVACVALIAQKRNPSEKAVSEGLNLFVLITVSVADYLRY